MAITRTTNDYEILIRFDETDGSFKGAHHATITIVKDGDEVLSMRQDAPVPMTLEEVQAAVAAIRA